MAEAEAAKVDTEPSIRRRWLLYLAVLTPVAALITLLAYGQVGTRGNPGGLAVNSQPGQVATALRAAPAFSIPRVDGGRSIDSASLRGRYAVIDFWSSWCPPCRLEAPELAAAYPALQAMGVEMVGIAIWDEQGAVLRHVTRYGVPYPNGVDERGRTAVAFGVRGIPEKFIIGPDGDVLLKFKGPVTSEQLVALVTGAIGR